MDRQIVRVLCGVALLAVVQARPDSAGHALPPSGLAYGGIPYGSMSGNVAEYFKKTAPSLGRTGHSARSVEPLALHPDYTPIEQWL